MARYILPIAGILILAIAPIAYAQPADGGNVSETAPEAWRAYYRQRAANDYDFVWSDSELPLVLKTNAIANWTNPLELGQINGSTFVWEHDGRPIVVGQLFSYLIGSDQRSLCHVFSTLTDDQVIGRRYGEVFWKPTLNNETGWHDARGTPVHSNRAGRLLQMRNLARQFKAYTEEASRGKRDLRLLPQPLFRSDATKKDFDCGLFSYVVGTDPELLILIECDLMQDAPVWRYRFVQSTRSTTVASFIDREVYRYEKSRSNVESPNAVYLSRHGVELIPGKFK